MLTVWDFHLLYRGEKKESCLPELVCQLAAKNALPGNPYTAIDLRERERESGVDEEEWITKMDWNVKTCKMYTGRRGKLGKWIGRMDQTGALGTSARRMEETRRDEWTARTNWAENSRCGEMERLIDVDVRGEKWVKKREGGRKDRSDCLN